MIPASRVVPDGDCLVFQGALDDLGRARITIEGKRVFVHKACYEAAYGPLPKGQALVNRCGNRACVNAEHWQALSHAEAAGTGPRGDVAALRLPDPQVIAWKAQGACVGLDPLAFACGTDDNRSTWEPVCATCPVRDQCDSYATERGIRTGVWGGQVRS